jgi:hypothetical protein
MKSRSIRPGAWVHFEIRNIYHPDPAAVLMALHGRDLVQGQVVDLSDSGTNEGVYAVVRVESLEQPVIVDVRWTRPSVPGG